jgi:hypothetical protein
METKLEVAFTSVRAEIVLQPQTKTEGSGREGVPGPALGFFLNSLVWKLFPALRYLQPFLLQASTSISMTSPLCFLSNQAIE